MTITTFSHNTKDSSCHIHLFFNWEWVSICYFHTIPEPPCARVGHGPCTCIGYEY